MYAAIDAVGLAEAAAGQIAMADRLRYAPFFAAAEAVIHGRGMVVGGEAGILLLLGQALGPGDFYYELYSDDSVADARALTEALYAVDPQGLGHYAHMLTDIPRQEFKISVDERLLFRVKALAVHRGARAADIIAPVRRPAHFARDGRDEPLPLLCMGAEVQLTSVYSGLTDPARAGDWARLLLVEEDLRALFAEGVRGIVELVGGRPAPEEEGEGGEEEAEEESAEGAAALRLAPEEEAEWPAPGRLASERAASEAAAGRLVSALRSEFAPRAGLVVLGQRAGAGPGTRLQVVSANRLGDEENTVGRIARRLGFHVQATTNDPKVPTDPRLRRVTFYLLRPGARREPFLDVFNSGGHELVPFLPPPGAAPGGARTGTVFVRLRFLLVDIWTMQLLFRMDATSAGYTRQVLGGLVASFDRTAAEYVAGRDAGADFAALFPDAPDDYIGRYEDPVVSQKRFRRAQLKKEDGRRLHFPPFYPARARARAEEQAPGVSE